MGETLREGTHLDIESDLNLIRETRRELKAQCSSEKAERRTMKELGLKRSGTMNDLYQKGWREKIGN
jgi:fatty acyl-CoA reductase